MQIGGYMSKNENTSQKINFQNANLSNMYLFNAVFQDKNNCKLLLEILLNRSVDIMDVKAENTIAISSDVKYIRLDILVTDSLDTRYDLEAQNKNERDLPKRSRYYQSLMDVASLNPGELYNKLGESFIIFICTFDPFKRGKYKYVYSNRSEDTGEPLGDGTTKIFFNTKGKDRENISDELYDFLKYFENSTDECIASIETEKIHKIHKQVTLIKENKKWEDGFMTMAEYIHNEAEDLAQDLAQGLAQEERIKDILSLLEDLGTVPDELSETIKSQKNSDILKKWIKLAARASSIEDFSQKIKNI